MFVPQPGPSLVRNGRSIAGWFEVFSRSQPAVCGSPAMLMNNHRWIQDRTGRVETTLKKGKHPLVLPASPDPDCFARTSPLSQPQVVWNEYFMESDEKESEASAAPYRRHARDSDVVPRRNHLPLCPGPTAPTSRGPTPQLWPPRRMCSRGIPSGLLSDRQSRERRRTSAGTL